MITLNTLPHIPHLDLPPNLKHFLTEQTITLPAEASDVPDETEATLIIFDQHVYNEMALLDEAYLEFVIGNAEFVLEAPDNYCLSLTIITDDGSGVFLLFPKGCNYPGLDSLASQAVTP